MGTGSPAQDNMKNCNICGISKRLIEFRINRRAKDGRQSKCILCAKEIDANFRQKNRDSLRIKYRKWNKRRVENGSWSKYMSEYNKRNRLAYNLRKRLQKALKGNFKSGSAVEDLGCSISELKLYLENQFEPDMSWDNYGEWHIDHIHPLSGFDLSDPEQIRKACHYMNLQPLWARDNQSKGDKLPEEFIKARGNLGHL